MKSRNAAVGSGREAVQNKWKQSDVAAADEWWKALAGNSKQPVTPAVAGQ